MERVILFLTDAVISFFTILFLLRFYMQWLRVSFANALGHFVVTLTNWAVRPLRRVIPGIFGLDMASLLVAFLLQLLFAVLALLLFPRFAVLDPAAVALPLLWAALIALLRLSIHVLIGALVIQVLLSWVNPYSPLATPVNQFNRPVLAPLRRFLPPISGIDLSPLVAILLAQAVLMLLP